MGGHRWAQLQASAGLYNPYGDAQLTQTASFVGTDTPFTVRGVGMDEMFIKLSAGGEFYFSPNGAIWLALQTRTGGSLTETNGVFGLSLRW